MSHMHVSDFEVRSPNVDYTDEHITSRYTYDTTEIVQEDGKTFAVPRQEIYQFRTDRRRPKVGLMLVGWGGNNGTTTTAGILANKHGLSWHTKEGVKKANYYGSLTQAATCRLGGTGPQHADVRMPFSSLLPMVDPSDLVLGGWDISALNIGDAMRRAKVLDWGLQEQLREEMRGMEPLPSVYYPDFIAANQAERADNVLPGSDKQAPSSSPASPACCAASHPPTDAPLLRRRTWIRSGRISAPSRRRTRSTRWWSCGRPTQSGSPPRWPASTTARTTCSRPSAARRRRCRPLPSSAQRRCSRAASSSTARRRTPLCRG